MASFMTAGNATNGLQVSSDNTGILELKTGTGSGTTALTIGTGQQVGYTAGTAAAPSITFTGDTNNGIYSPGADRIGFTTNGTQRGEFDSSGNFLMTQAGGGLGYGTGAGGTVTQATNKSTAVTLNKPTGQITMNNAALAAGASVTFNHNNSLLATGDTVVATVNGGVTASGAYRLETIWAQAGLIIYRLTNISGGSLSEALQFSFTIIKGATA